MKSMPELKEIVEAYKPSVIWSDGSGSKPISDYFKPLTPVSMEDRCTIYLLERHRLHRLALQRQSCQRHRGE